MSRPHNNPSPASDSLHDLRVIKWWVRLVAYAGALALVSSEQLALGLPLIHLFSGYAGSLLVVAVSVEFGFAHFSRLRKQSVYPAVLAEELGPVHNLREACDTGIRAVVELLRADAAVLALLRRDSADLEMLVSHGLPSGVIKFNVDQVPLLDPYRRCAESRAILVQPIPRSHPYFPVFGPNRRRVYVPILSMDKVVGVISIVGPRRRSELRDRTLLTALARVMGHALDTVRLYNHEYQGMLHILTSALDQRDRVTDGHSRRVADLSLMVARELGIQGDDLLDIERAAILHDIGKLAVPDAILSKPAPLTSDEWLEMRRHPDVGYNLVRDVPFLYHPAEIIRAHHERFDGSGYPRGLRGEEIPLGARIFAVVDAYDAMTSDRPYRLARSHEEALEEIRHQVGSQFDPVVVAPFFAAVRKGLIGPSTPVKEHELLFGMTGGNGPTPAPEESHVPAS